MWNETHLEKDEDKDRKTLKRISSTASSCIPQLKFMSEHRKNKKDRPLGLTHRLTDMKVFIQL